MEIFLIMGLASLLTDLPVGAEQEFGAVSDLWNAVLFGCPRRYGDRIFCASPPVQANGFLPPWEMIEYLPSPRRAIQ